MNNKMFTYAALYHYAPHATTSLTEEEYSHLVKFHHFI